MQLSLADDEARKMSVDNPEWRQVEAAIRRLDGNRNTDITLGRIGGDPFIGIGGGAGRFFVFIWTEDERNLILTTGRSLEGRERLIVGGQMGSFPSHQIVGLAEALRTAQTYLEKGEPDPTLTWEEG